MSKTVVLFRHGTASHDFYERDSFRPLSEEGASEVKITTMMLKQRGIFPNIIYTSPVLRAKESTAVICAEYSVDFRCEDALGEKFNDDKIVKLLQDAPPDATILLVGHEPSLGHLANKLANKEIFPAGLSKAAACAIKFKDKVAPGKGELLDYIAP